MRFINTNTLLFSDPSDDHSNGRYAMLSHRWGRQEVSHEDYREELPQIRARLQHNRQDLKRLAEWYSERGNVGMTKIINFCRIAAQAGIEWAWIDTCCIDKRSSAEQTMAINSMYKWYEGCAKCIVYLADTNEKRMWTSSVWWKRGWTFQELIAPKDVKFYDANWNPIASKKNDASEIENATGLPVKLLRECDRKMLNKCSVAQKMSWASGRTTTLPEDRAYCLMGLFGVNMPLLYGEGTKAFQRLGREILDLTGDESIFAFASDQKECSRLNCIPLFPTSPEQFAGDTREWRLERKSPIRYVTSRVKIRTEAVQVIVPMVGGAEQTYFLLKLACGSFPDTSLDPETPCYIGVKLYEQNWDTIIDCVRIPLPHTTDQGRMVEQLCQRHLKKGHPPPVAQWGPRHDLTFYVLINI